MRFGFDYLFLVRRYAADKWGAVAVEYAFLAAFVSIAAVVGMVLVGPELREFFTDTSNAVQGAGSANVGEPPAGSGFTPST